MRICLINHSFPPQIGGGETHIYLLARGFARKGHEVTVVTSDAADNLSAEDDEQQFSVVRIKNLKGFERGMLSFRHVLKDFKEALPGSYFDVVHVHNFMPALAYATIASLVKTKKVIFTFHSTPVPQEGKIIGHFSDYALEKAFASFIIKLPFYDRIVCPSRYYYSWAVKLGADKSKIELVYHGVEADDFPLDRDNTWRKEYNYNEDDFVVVCPARMIHRKGIIDLVKAMEIIEDGSVKLLLLTSIQSGSAEYERQVRTFIGDHNLSNKVRIVADKENSKTMPRILRNCDTCVLPSHVEGLGIALLEAMAAGIPVVGSNTSGINEIIRDGVNGLLCRPKNPQDLADKILRIRQDRKLSDSLIMGGRRSVHSRFSLRKQLERLELIYQ